MIMGDAGAKLTARPSIVVISDFMDGPPPNKKYRARSERNDEHLWGGHQSPWPAAVSNIAPTVQGGYLERLPLALIATGAVEQAEIWHHWRGEGPPPFFRENPYLARRAFRADSWEAPYVSRDMLDFIYRFGAPHILIVLGLGVDAAILKACARSVIIYNSIDAPALRVPPNISEMFDLIITGAQWQSDIVEDLHPGMPTIILPIGPEFASPDQFYPLGTPKYFDLIYVAAAQHYKRHDILFDALAKLPRDIKAICLFGYGEMGDELRDKAAQLQLSIDFVGPPGVPIAEVNRLMNLARFGVVCGIDDGAPAIITEYMLAGLPVLANAELSCGQQFILPDTGMLANATDFAKAIMAMRKQYTVFSPRDVAIARWSWPHSVRRLLENEAFKSAAALVETRVARSVHT